MKITKKELNTIIESKVSKMLKESNTCKSKINEAKVWHQNSKATAKYKSNIDDKWAGVQDMKKDILQWVGVMHNESGNYKDLLKGLELVVATIKKNSPLK